MVIINTVDIFVNISFKNCLFFGYLITKYSQLRLIEPPVNRFHRLIGSKFHRIYRTELQFGLQYFRLIDFSA